MSQTIFAKIIEGRVKCHRVYENQHVLAFLDIQPLSKGHTLLIPKEPAVTMDQLSSAAAAALGQALPPLCRAIMQATGCRDYNILQNNGTTAHQTVMHVHFHIIPKPAAQHGLQLLWQDAPLTDTAAALAEAIAHAMPKPAH